MTQLNRFRAPLGKGQLAEALVRPERFPSDPVGSHEVDFSEVEDLVLSFESEQGRGPASWDRELAPILHQALLGRISRRALLDPAFWHWMTVVRLPRFVWLRWLGQEPENPEEILLKKPALVERFLGAATLRGVSRNALARLFWVADLLHDSEEGYVWVQEALKNQDFFQAIFERLLGLHRDAAVACLRVLRDSSESQRRDAVRRLNHYLTTTTLEALSSGDVERLLA